MTNSNLDVTKFLAEITGLSVPSTTTEASAPVGNGSTCPCGQPKMSGDRAVYCAHHSKQGSLVFSHLPGEHRNWKEALTKRDASAHAKIESMLVSTVGGLEAYNALMNAPRRPVAFRNTKKVPASAGGGLVTPPAPPTVEVTGAVHAASLVVKLDAVIMALADLRMELANLRDGK